MKHQIVLESWEWECGDNCCGDWGTNLIVNDELVYQYFDYDEEWLGEFLKALKITDFEIERKSGGNE